MNSHERYLILIGRSSSYVVISMLLLCLAAPSLPNTVLHYSMEEELPLNTEVGNLPQDANLSVVSPVSPSLLQYSLLGDTSTDPTLHYLAVNQTTGLLYIIKLLDREEVCKPVPECQLVFGVAAFIGQFIHMITVHLDIGDLNDNIPTFSKDHISLSINENTPIGMKYTLPAAKDRDSGSFGVQRYDLDSTFGVFSLDQTQQLKLEITGNLDRETANHYELHLLAYDGGFPPNAGLLTINITIADLNDNVPLFNVSSLEITLPENTTAPSWIAGIHATDDDSGQNGVVRYSLAQDATDTVGKLFRIDPGSGEIYLIGTLDFETAKSYHFEIQAFDHGATSHVSFVTVTVMVEDVNDNSPKIKISSLSSDNLPVVLENSNAGVFVAHVTVSDDDSGDNGDTLCEVNSDFFQLEPLWRSQYQVLTAITFDREEEPFYAITIVCQDSGNPVMRSEKTFNIHIGDENDNVPTFSEQFYSAIIQENNAAGDVLLTFTASDADEGDNGRIEYSILGGASSVFFVDETTSHLKASIGLDFELASVYQFQVEVKDNGVPSLSSTATVEITVIDLNDELPKFLHDSYPLTVLENQPGGQLTGQVSAIDPDGVSAQDIRYFFWIDDTFQTSSIGAFILHSTTGEIKTLASLDREIQDHYDLTVSCYNMDNITMSSTAQVTILVIDENDNAPVFLYPSRENNTIVLSGDIMQGSPIAQLKALDADSGANGELSYSLLENSNDLFSVETQSGELRMSDPQSDGGFDVHQLKISVSDNGMPKHNATALFYVVMNGSLSYIWTEEPDANVKDDNGGLGLSGSSLVTFVCIVSVAGVVTTILLAAIVLVLWRGRKKRQLSEYGHQPGFMIGECRAGGVTTSSNLSNNLNASFQSEEDLKIEGLRLHGRLTTTPKGHTQGRLCVPNGGSPNKILLPSPVDPHTYIQVQRFLELMEDQDVQSSCSEELSNADSGNGTSMEGETPVKKGAAVVRTENSSTRRVIQAGHMCQRKLSVEARIMEAQMYACSSGSRDSPGPRDCSEPIRTNHCQEVQHRESVSSSTSSDDLFPRSMRTSVQQPKHGILKTKIRERLNPQRNRHLANDRDSSLTQARVHFQHHQDIPIGETQTACDERYYCDTERRQDLLGSNIVDLDTDDALEITI